MSGSVASRAGLSVLRQKPKVNRFDYGLLSRRYVEFPAKILYMEVNGGFRAAEYLGDFPRRFSCRNPVQTFDLSRRGVSICLGGGWFPSHVMQGRFQYEVSQAGKHW